MEENEGKLTLQQRPLLFKPLHRRILYEPLRKRIHRIDHRNHPLIPPRRILQPLHLHHTLPIINLQLLAQKPQHGLLKPVLWENPIDQPPPLELLDRDLPPEHQEVVGAVHAHALRERDRGPVLGHQPQRAERCLQVCARGGQEDVGDALEPGGAAADAGAVEGEDDDFAVVD